MPTEKRVLCVEIGARPEVIYDAWLSSSTHSAMTGAPASIEPRVGGKHDAWDGYISGEITALEPHARIAMTWRTTEFGSAPDSTLEVLLEQVDEDDTLLTLVHEEIPEGQGDKYQQGWADFYFDPMIAFFGKRAKGKKPGAKQRKKALEKVETKGEKAESKALKADQKAAEALAKAEKATKKADKPKKAEKKADKPKKAEKKARKATEKAVKKAHEAHEAAGKASKKAAKSLKAKKAEKLQKHPKPAKPKR
jgi:uncharacterized protein YndB with AHSA1/START domain